MTKEQLQSLPKSSLGALLYTTRPINAKLRYGTENKMETIPSNTNIWYKGTVGGMAYVYWTGKVQPSMITVKEAHTYVVPEATLLQSVNALGVIDLLKTGDAVINAAGVRLLVSRITPTEYYLTKFGQPGESPFLKSKVESYIKTGQWKKA